MKAIVKSFWIDNSKTSFEDYVPIEEDNFGLWVEMRVGSTDSLGGDDFRIFVCTPKWLCDNVWEPRWGRHMLILRKYEYQTIEDRVKSYVESCQDDDWRNVATKIARNLAWEFEDYRG